MCSPAIRRAASAGGQGLYVLQSGRTGETLAAIDGTRLTHWRTAAASALAARHLARADAKRLLIVGAGALAPFLARAHASVRRYETIAVWNHRPRARGACGERSRDMAFLPEPAEDLEAAVAEADVISCATLATAPLIAGRWLQAGTASRPRRRVQSVDARGRRRGAASAPAFSSTPTPRSSKAATWRSASQRGDRRGPTSSPTSPALCRGAPGRRNADEITLVQVGRRGDRGSGGGDPGLAQGGRRGAVRRREVRTRVGEFGAPHFGGSAFKASETASEPPSFLASTASGGSIRNSIWRRLLFRGFRAARLETENGVGPLESRTSFASPACPAQQARN